MTALSKTAFYTKWGDPSGQFETNSIRAISEADMQEFATDIKDSCTFGGSINWITVEIGDWNMDTGATKSVAHGIADYKKIRSVSGIIRDDSDDRYSNISSDDGSGGVYGGIGYILGSSDPTLLILSRTTGGFFDSVNYNATSFNRGWITIGYVD